MNSQPEQGLQLPQQLEAELTPPVTPTIISQPQTLEQLQTDTATAQSQLRLFNWFNSLSGLGKLIVIGVAAIVGIAILRAVLKLVAAVISLTILAVLLYVAYQFFLVRNTKTEE